MQMECVAKFVGEGTSLACTHMLGCLNRLTGSVVLCVGPSVLLSLTLILGELLPL